MTISYRRDEPKSAKPACFGSQVKSSTAPPLKGSARAAKWVPLWRIIERIASAIGDSREPEHYAKTRLYTFGRQRLTDD
jgi:hypothetical protein